MIFSDSFEGSVMDILQACVFIGAQLFVNGERQGVIESAQLEQADVYELRLNGVSLAQINGYSCGMRNGIRFVSIGTTCDTIAVFGDKKLATVYIESSETKRACSSY